MDKLSPNRPKDPVPAPCSLSLPPLTKWSYHRLVSKPSAAVHCWLPQTQAQYPGLCGPVPHPCWTTILSTWGTPPPPAHPNYTSSAFNYSDITSSRKVSCLDASRPVGAAHGLPRLPVLPPPHGLVTQLSVPVLRGSAALAAGAWGWGQGEVGGNEENTAAVRMCARAHAA